LQGRVKDMRFSSPIKAMNRLRVTDGRSREEISQIPKDMGKGRKIHAGEGRREKVFEYGRNVRHNQLSR